MREKLHWRRQGRQQLFVIARDGAHSCNLSRRPAFHPRNLSCDLLLPVTLRAGWEGGGWSSSWMVDQWLIKMMGFSMWMFPKIVVPQNGWLIMEIPIKMGDLGVPFSGFSRWDHWQQLSGPASRNSSTRLGEGLRSGEIQIADFWKIEHMPWKPWLGSGFLYLFWKKNSPKFGEDFPYFFRWGGFSPPTTCFDRSHDHLQKLHPDSWRNGIGWLEEVHWECRSFKGFKILQGNPWSLGSLILFRTQLYNTYRYRLKILSEFTDANQGNCCCSLAAFKLKEVCLKWWIMNCCRISSGYESVNWSPLKFCFNEILPCLNLNAGAGGILSWARRKGPQEEKENRNLPSSVTRTRQDEPRHRIIGWLGFVMLHTMLSFDTSMALRLPWGLFLSLLKTMSMLMDMSTSQGVGNARVLREILMEFLPTWA